MKIVNGNIVPDYDARLIQAALAFLERPQMTLSGAEAQTHVAACNLLRGILSGDVEVPLNNPAQPATPDIAAPSIRAAVTA